MTFLHVRLILYLLVVADVEGEGGDVPGDVGREARESLRGQRHERLPVGLLVGREAAGRGLLVQVRVNRVERNYGARGEEHRVEAAPTVSDSAIQRGLVNGVTVVDTRSGSSRE